MTLAELNALDRTRFTALLGGVFEHSPWAAECAWEQAPFASVEALHAAMCAVVDAAGDDAALQLLRAHPQLAGRAAVRGELTEASTREQRGAGLDQCTPEEYERLQRLNAAYEERFGFPFILAVRGHSRDSILADMERRLGNTREAEFAQALQQVRRIAALRLHDMIGP